MSTEAPRRIQRKRTKGWKMPANTVYVGRPGKWGNPFAVGDESAYVNGMPVHGLEEPLTAQDAVDLYRIDLKHSWAGSEIYDRIRDELAGKNLACWCREDQPCHADVLLELANGGNQ